jgi:6,7-dimethyl-8-ribityllumazine synthase
VPIEYTGKTGSLDKKHFAVVVSSYHRQITGPLLTGAMETLAAAGVADKNIEVAWVPGAWEISLATKRLIDTKRFDALICLGCVIKGETTHDQHINSMVSSTLGQMSVDAGIPVAFGLLTCNSFQQAIERSGGEVGNKGVEAADAAVQMVRLLGEIA